MTEAVAACLADLTGTGLEISAPENGETSRVPSFPTETITAYILMAPTEADRKAARKKMSDLRHFLGHITHIFPDCPSPVLHTEIIAEEDWGEKWKSFFTSFHITPTLTIKPSWEEAEAHANGSLVIEMDPGLAFGTGHHASTQLALLLLEKLFQDKGKRLEKALDLGTGSGILAMACALFGAREVLAIDNDADALEAARQNVLRNGLAGRITVSSEAISAVKGDFDLVVANITHDILAELATLLAGLIKPQGFLVLAGILQGDQEHSISNIYAKQGLVCMERLTRDEWTALQFHQN